MAKVQKIAEITPNLPFSEFNFYDLYRSTFEKSELGRIKSPLPLGEMRRTSDLFISIAVEKETDGGFGNCRGGNIDRVVLKLRPGITGPATLKYRAEDEMLEEFVLKARSEVGGLNLGVALPDVNSMSDQELAVWYNDNVIYPDKVRLNKWYYEHYSFWVSLR